jgi:energy-coupling factor transporter ATP-binding protein EcfA2
MNQLIGIIGKKGHGKSALADALATITEGYTTEIAFAGPLKEAARIIFRLNDEQLHGELKEKKDLHWNKTPRELLQLLDTEVGRAIDPEVWIKSALYRAEAAWEADPDTIVVVTDVRFENEAAFILARGGLLVRVERPDPQICMFEAHFSEIEMEMEKIVTHLTVVNDGSLKALESAAEWVEEWLSRQLSSGIDENRFVCSAMESELED